MGLTSAGRDHEALCELTNWCIGFFGIGTEFEGSWFDGHLPDLSEIPALREAMNLTAGPVRD